MNEKSDSEKRGKNYYFVNSTYKITMFLTQIYTSYIYIYMVYIHTYIYIFIYIYIYMIKYIDIFIMFLMQGKLMW